jgi:hypothetical protein
MRTFPLFLVLVAAACGWSQPAAQTMSAAPANQHFDGKWWSTTSSEERSGFINGVADCLTWSAHEQGFSATPEQLVDKITAFYEEHPGSGDLTVVDVWRRVGRKSSPDGGITPHGETWKNPHWYLDGFWWREAGEGERLGFLEGYLWCMRTHVSAPSEKYSKAVSFYMERIDAFVRGNGSSKANREAIALILRRYQDEKNSGNPR